MKKIEKIDLFMPPQSQYGVLHHFTKKLWEALSRNSITSRILEAVKEDPKPFLDQLFLDNPDCTLSFNGLLPDNEGRFFCDLISIPHIAFLVDSPNDFIPLVRSKRTIISCIDRYSCDFFRGLGFDRVFFLPHGVDRNLAPEKTEHREYDVVMLASCIDYETDRVQWKNKYPIVLCKIMEEAAEDTLASADKPYYQSFVDALDHHLNRKADIDPRRIDFVSVLDDIETYIKGKDRVELLRAIKDAKVDVFGSGDGRTTWKKYLGVSNSNIVIHDPVPFEQALEIMKHSKILLNSCSWIKYGAHERIFSAMACEALVITNENLYLKEQFKDSESIAFFQPQRYEKANHRVNEYLENSSKRVKVAAKGREIVMNSHTWDHRVQELIHQVSPLLDKALQNSV